MLEEKKDTIRFVEKGDKVVIKTETPENVELDSKGVLIQIKAFKDTITKTEGQMEQIKANLIHGVATIQGNQRRLKEIMKFEPKMRAIQESKAKAIYNEIKAEVEKQVRDEYIYDKALIEADNKVQMFAIYQKAIATNTRVANELAPTIITKMYYVDRENKKENILENPFK